MLDYNAVMEEIAKYKRIMDETENILEELKTSLKTYMTENNIEVLIGTEHKAKYRSIDKHTIDGKKLKEDFPEIAAKYTVNKPYMRLDVT
jgi:predicted phage-related endonuclease